MAPPPVRPAVFGVCGGVGSGKSAVAAALAARGAFVVDADRLAHEALDRPDVRESLVQEFGTGILGPDSRIERSLLRPLVFGDSPEHHARRRRLELVVHPVVRRMMQEAVEAAARRNPPPPFLVLDVPLLTEGPTASWCDAIVFVDAPAEVRRARTARNRGWSDAEHERRERAQDPVEVKRRAAQFVFANDGDAGPSPAGIDRLFASLAAFRPAERA
jgi:dephospho-CoA kinase